MSRPHSERGRFDDMPTDAPFPGVTRASFTSAKATVNRYAFAPGATFPLHAHPEEQITLVERGRVELTIGGESQALDVGDWSVVAPDAPHGITAGPAGAAIVAIIVPARRHPDAYALVGEEA